VWWGPGKGLGIFRVNVLCQQPVSVAVGKEFFYFFTTTTFANSFSLLAVGEDTFANNITKPLGNNVCIFSFSPSTFFAGFSYYNYISTS
jgi:hypothetical protein